MDDVVHVEVAWDVDPLTRPTAPDWTRLGTVDANILVEALETSRGVNIRTGDIETGTATAKIHDPSGNLDPSNAASTWSPNVVPRRRIRFVVDPNGADPEVVIWTGFIRNIPPKWRLAVQWTALTAAGLIWLLSDTALPPSVLHAENVDAAPVAYWPMTESTGNVVEDVVGTVDGTLTFAADASTPVTSWAAGGQTFGIPTESFPAGRSMIMRLPGTAQMTVSYWFRADLGANTGTLSNWAHSNVLPPAVGPSTLEAISIATVAPGSSGAVTVRIGGTVAGLAVVTAGGTQIRDGEPHHIALTLDSTTDIVNVYVDGVRRPWEDEVADAAEIAAVDLATLVASLEHVRVGHGLSVVSAGTTEARAVVGHMAYFDRVLTAAEVATIHAGGVNAWAGDLTGARLNRILDLAGVDAGDRDIAAGTQTCGPTLLAGENVTTYIRKIAATEGGPIGEDAEGRIFMRERVANDPTVTATFSDDTATDGGSPVADLDPEFSLDRAVNICRVTRENGTTQEATAAASLATYGPSTLSLDTLHQSASGARSTASRHTIRSHDPRLVFPFVSADSVDTSSTVMTGTDIGEAVEVFGRPPRGGTAIQQVSIVERVEHKFAGAESWVTTFGVAEHVVLPDFWWDEPGQGWDESVWVAP